MPPLLLLSALLVQSGESPYSVDWEVDGVLTGGAWAFALLANDIAKTLPGGLHCKVLLEGRCDPSVLNTLDRTVVGNDSDGWVLVSDIGLLGGLLIPFGANAIDVATSGSETRWNDLGRDSLVIAQAIGVNALITSVTKATFRRSRPTHYVAGKDVTDVREQFSFPSGHTSTTAAGLTAWATTYSLRHPNSRWRFAVIGSAVAWTGLTGYGRVAGGRHFYTDVLSGAALGAAVGFIVPKLHERDDDEDIIESGQTSPSFMLKLGGSF